MRPSCKDDIVVPGAQRGVPGMTEKPRHIRYVPETRIGVAAFYSDRLTTHQHGVNKDQTSTNVIYYIFHIFGL